MSSDQAHPTRSVQHKRPSEVWPNNWRGASTRWLVHWYLSYSPASVRVYHKAVFRSVWLQSRSPYTSSNPQNASSPVSIPLKRDASGTRRLTWPPWRGLKPRETVPWGRQDFHRRGKPNMNHAVHNTASSSVTQQLERRTNNDWCTGICLSAHQTDEYGTRPF